MSASYTSKHGIVSRPQYELYMMFTDMKRLAEMVPPSYKDNVQADFDRVEATVKGFTIAVKVTERHPYDYIIIDDDGAPFHFRVTLHFDTFAEAAKTDFSIALDADLNMMMKMMIGGKIQEALDKMVDALVAVSEGRMPEGVDMSQFNK